MSNIDTAIRTIIDEASGASSETLIEREKEVTKALQCVSDFLSYDRPSIGYKTVVAEILDKLALSKLFDFLMRTFDETQIQITCHIIKSLLETSDYLQVHHDLKTKLIHGLRASNESVRLLATDELVKCTQKEEYMAMMSLSDIFPVALDCLSDTNVSVATKIADLLLKMANTKAGLHMLHAPPVTSIFLTLIEKDEITRLRIYELFARMSRVNEESFLMFKNSVILKSLASELESADFLSRMNLLEVLKKMCKTKRDLALLEDNEIIKKIARSLSLTQNENDDCALICASLKFFVHLLGIPEVDFQSLDQRYHLSHIMLVFLNDSTPSILETTVECIGLIGNRVAGFHMITSPQLHPSSGQSTSLAQEIFLTYGKASNSLQLTWLGSIAMILSVMPIDQQISDEAHRLFLKMADNPILKLIENIRKPFEDLRFTTFSILAAISQYSWGKRLIASTRELVEFLLNRETESSKIGKEWKLAIIQKSILSEDSETHLTSPIYTQFKRYLREGLFYKEAQASVATEFS